MNDLEYHLYEEAKAGRMNRQQLLVRASVIGASMPALAAGALMFEGVRGEVSSAGAMAGMMLIALAFGLTSN